MKYAKDEYVVLTNEEFNSLLNQVKAEYSASEFEDFSEAHKISLVVSKAVNSTKVKAVVIDGVIKWSPYSERLGTGEYDDPKEFIDGDFVEVGKFYCRCKVSAKGNVYKQATMGTYKALINGCPTWKAMTAFEFIY